MKMLLKFAVGCLIMGQALAAPTCLQINSMRQAIVGTLQTYPPLMPLYVRLGFHDCVGGCNGCINFNNPDNNGLGPAVSNLTTLYTANNFKSYGVSLADFFALAATIGVTVAVQGSNRARNGGLACSPQSCPGPCPVPCFPLSWGRTDATTCLNEPALPSPKMTGAAMYSYFQTQFGFTQAQVVALMGAHSLGGAKPFNSGYAGKWTGPQNPGFNELYYLNMVNSTIVWTNVNAANRTSPPKWQFNGKLTDGSQAGFMLNTDFELYYDLTLDSTTAQATCTLNPTCGLSTPNTCSGSCQPATTFSQALGYSKNCTLFMGDFVSVFSKMLNNGYTSLTPTTCCPV